MNYFGRKYYLNPETLRFERVTLTSRQRFHYGLLIGAGLIALAVLLRFGFERYYPTPRQVLYQKANAKLRAEYNSLNRELEEVEYRLTELRDRDDRLYRSILNLEPVPQSIRGAGTGGSDPNLHLRNLRNPGMVVDVSRKLDKLSNRALIQSNSLEDVYREALTTKEFLACKPSINPLSSADPFWMTSSYGFRKDPFTSVRTVHLGIDLAGPYGLEIHCTGDGTVISAHFNRHGYGKEVLVDHGFGYISRYAHLQEIRVKRGQKLKRGEILGTLGSTGRSTGPHLHYEIRKNGRPVNPMYFFYENLTPSEYVRLAAQANAGSPDHHTGAMAQK